MGAVMSDPPKMQHVTKSARGQPGTTLYYSQLHHEAAIRAAKLGIAEQAEIFTALQSCWAALPSIAGLPDDQFKTAVRKLMALPDA